MRRTRGTSLGVALVLAAARAAAGDVDLAVQNGDRILGTLDPGGEVEVYRAAVPAGAALTAKAKAGKGGPPLRVRILDPDGGVLADLAGPKSVKAAAIAASTGAHAIEVTRAAGGGAATGDYSVAVTWKSPKSYAVTAEIASGSIGELPFAFDPGATLTFTVKAAKKSNARPVLTEVGTPDPQHPYDLPNGTTATLVLATSGQHYFRFVNTAPEAGVVSASVKVASLKPLKRTLRLTGAAAPGDVSVLAAALVGPDGGQVPAPAASLVAGASCSIPAGALPVPTSVLVGMSVTVETLDPGRAAGPAVFFGPSGLTFAAPAVATITLPYDPAMFPADTSLLRVYTRDASGAVTEITGVTIDAVLHTVSFAAPHFSSFQVFRRFPVAENPSPPSSSPVVANARFGSAVAVDGDVVAVGVPDATVSGEAGAGQVSIFRRNGSLYALETTVALGTPSASEGFGRSLALEGQTLIVGAPGRRDGGGVRRGAAYVVEFADGTWTRTARLAPSAAAADDLFGSAVALSAGRALVGAPGDDGAGLGVGAASVFVDAGSFWSEEARLEPDLAGAPQEFGASVAIEGNTAVIGAPGTGGSLGAVYVFLRTSGWAFDQGFSTPSSSTSGRFGRQVAIDAGLVAVGAFADDAAGAASGAVFVFDATDGPAALLQTLHSDDPASGESPEGDQFGQTLAMRNGILAAGAPVRGLELPGGTLDSSGQVFVFEKTGATFRRVARLRGASAGTSTPSALEQFGGALAFDGTTIVVGAPERSVASQQSAGGVFVFDVGN